MRHLFPSRRIYLSLFAAIFLAPSGLLGGSQHIFHLTNGLTSAEVPFTLVEDLIIVEAVIAGKRSLNFILDNGTSTPVIFDPEYIRGLSLALGTQITFRGAGAGKAVTSRVIKGTSLHLSGAATDRIGMVVLDKNPFQHLSFGGLEIHGVLGSTLFRSFVVEIDYPNRLLRLHQHDSFRPPVSYQPLPMKVVDSKPYIPAIIEGKRSALEAYLMLDLGFNNALMLQLTTPVARDMLTHRVVTKVGTGYSGAFSGRIGRIASVRIGSKEMTHVATIAPFNRGYPTVDVSPDIKRLGSVGNALFRDTAIILNYPDETFYIYHPETYVAEQEAEIPSPTVGEKESKKLIF